MDRIILIFLFTFLFLIPIQSRASIDRQEQAYKEESRYRSFLIEVNSIADPTLPIQALTKEERKLALDAIEDLQDQSLLMRKLETLVHEMDIPLLSPQDQIRWFNTNTFWFTLADLVNFKEDLPLVLAEKTIKAGDVLQVEHFACDVHLPSLYIVVPREQRFIPVKRYVDLLIYQDSENHSSAHDTFIRLMRDDYDIKIK